jgi:hypothetical protein
MCAIFQGMMNANSKLPINSANPPTYWFRGLPFTAANKLAVDTVAPIVSYQNGLPFTAAGKVACGTGTPTNWCNGVPFLSDGRVAQASGVNPAPNYSQGVGLTAALQLAWE